MSRLMEEGGCCVCSESTAEGENVIVYCDGPGCNLGTHKACYGIIDIPKDNWYCQKCVYEAKGSKVVCELCPFHDGAFKRTNRNKWCHVICALYIPEATFLDTRKMESINLDSIPNDRFQKICYVCEDKGKESKKYGACIPCSFINCRFSFHVTCGHLEGLLVENVSRNSKIEYQGYCKMHIKNVTKIQGIRPLARYNAKRIRHPSVSSSVTSGSRDSPDKEGPPLLKPEVPAPGANIPLSVLLTEQNSKPPPIKKARKCSSSSSNGRGGTSSSHRKSQNVTSNNSGFLQTILSGVQGGAAARSASALLTNSETRTREYHAPHLPQPLDALEILGIGQPTPVAQRGLQTMEQLLEWQWNEGGQMLMQNAERGLGGGDTVDTADIVSLLSCLHELKAQNERLQKQVLELENKKGHLSHVTSRLAETLNKFGGSTASSAPVISPVGITQSTSHNGATTSQMPATLTPAPSGALPSTNHSPRNIPVSTPSVQSINSAASNSSHSIQQTRVGVSAHHAPELHPATISSANTMGMDSGRRLNSHSLVTAAASAAGHGTIPGTTSSSYSNGCVNLLVGSSAPAAHLHKAGALSQGQQLSSSSTAATTLPAALPVIGSEGHSSMGVASITVPDVRSA